MIKMMMVILMFPVVWYGLMLGCCLVTCKNDFVSLFAVARAVLLHDIKFLKTNCNYTQAKIICTILFVGTAVIGNVLSNNIL